MAFKASCGEARGVKEWRAYERQGNGTGKGHLQGSFGRNGRGSTEPASGTGEVGVPGLICKARGCEPRPALPDTVEAVC